MVLNEFPDLTWLKNQANSHFENRSGWNGRILTERGWPTVLMNVKASGIFRDNIRGPFSLFGNLNGTSFVKVDNRKVKLNDDCFFITNAGQNYTLEVEQKSETETFNIHFGDRFCDDLIQSQSISGNKLLDQGQHSTQPFSFHNRLMRKTEKVKQLISAIKTNTDELREAELLSALFVELFTDQLKLNRTATDFPSLKKSTRDELMKRILLSTDYIHEFYNHSLSLDELAKVSCLSKFHFLRLFKIAMGQTPHQFIMQMRIEKSKELLRGSNLEVKHVADSVGFADSSSFSRAFYQYAGAYPSQFRARLR